jgi:hypothetical protein
LPHKPKQGICAYCGAVGEVTDDHVIPQCLWPGRVSADVIPIIDACPECNNKKKSGDDSYLRDVLVNDQDSSHHNIVQKIRPNFQRSVGRKQSAMYKDFKKDGKVIHTRHPSSLIVPGQVSEEADKRVIAILSQIVRGLHYHYLKEPLSKDSTFWIGRLRDKAQIEDTTKDIAGFTGDYHRGGFKSISDGRVFSCGYVELDTAQHTTLWQLIFYDSVVFRVVTNPVQTTFTS